MTTHERVQAIAALGFTERQASFLAAVALHSGYCLRRQYETFAGIRYGKNVRAFLDGLVRREFAVRFGGRADRGHIYHLHSRRLFGVIGEVDHRHRRPASLAQIARRLMLLDVVISRRDVAWFATDAEKTDLFASRFHVPTHVLPQRASTADAAAAPEYFPHHLPIFLSPDGVPNFVYLAADGSADAFATFLRDHAVLLRSLSRWGILTVGPRHWAGLAPVFDAFNASLGATVSGADDELQWYFERRQLVDRGDLAQISVFDLRRFRTLRQRFDSPAHERLYAEWLETGRTDAGTPGSPTGDSTGTLTSDVLPFAYEQFGSLPGVA
jgi:hypothetical protein